MLGRLISGAMVGKASGARTADDATTFGTSLTAASITPRVFRMASLTGVSYTGIQSPDIQRDQLSRTAFHIERKSVRFRVRENLFSDYRLPVIIEHLDR